MTKKWLIEYIWVRGYRRWSPAMACPPTCPGMIRGGNAYD